MPNRTRQLAENAIMLGISAVLLMLATYTFIGSTAFFIIPVPFILLARQRSFRDMLFIVGTFGFLGMIITGVAGILPALMLGGMGFVMGYLYKRTNSALPAILGGAGAWIVSVIVSLIITIYVMGVDVLGEFNKVSQAMMNGDIPFALPPGMTLEQFKQQYSLLLNDLKLLFPSLMMMSAIMASAINHWLARVITKRMGSPVPALKPLKEWNLPRSILYYYFVALIGFLFFYQSITDTFLKSAILNLKTVLEWLFIIQGLGFVAFFLDLKFRNKVPKVLTVSLFIFLLLTNILSLLGIFDLGLGLRKRLERRM